MRQTTTPTISTALSDDNAFCGRGLWLSPYALFAGYGCRHTPFLRAMAVAIRPFVLIIARGDSYAMQRKIDVQWHSDYERYANYRPSMVMLLGKKKIVNSWSDLFYDVMLALYQKDTESFKKMNARYDFGDIFLNVNDSDRATRGLPNDCKAPFLVTKLPIDALLDYIAQAMRWFDLEDDDIQISCVAITSISAGIAPSIAEQMRKDSIEEEKFLKRCRHGESNDKGRALYSWNSMSRFPNMNQRGVVFVGDKLPEDGDSERRGDGVCAESQHKSGFNSERRRIEWAPGQFRRYLRTSPVALSMPNQSANDVESWSDLFQNACQWLAMIDKTAFFNAFKSQSMISWVPPQLPYCKMRKPFFIENCRLWIESGRTAPEILDALYYLLRRFGIDLNEVTIWFVDEE